MTKRIALVGAGRIGTHHAKALVDDVHGIKLVIISDPMSPNLDALAKELNVEKTTRDPLAIANDPDIDAVIISSPAATHAELIEAYARAGKDIFTEKPLGTSLAEARKIKEIVKETGVKLQIGFNRRFAQSWSESKQLIEDGKIGSVQRLRSVTRDPGPFGADPSKVPPNTIFNETLIHDYDVLNWLNAGSQPVGVYAMADALVAPEAREAGFLDSAVVTIRYDNGALATAEASFSAMYGYDLRGEAFGSKGMLEIGTIPNSPTRLYTADGEWADTAGTDTSRFHESYVGEFQRFSDLINGKDVDYPSVEDGLLAQMVAQASIVSAAEDRPVSLKEISDQD